MRGMGATPRRFGWAVAVAGMLLGASGAAADDGPIPRRVLDPLDQCPCWTGRAESLLLWRDAPEGVPLFQPFDGGAGAAVAPIDAAGFASDMAAGPRFALFRHTGDSGAIEFNYFNVWDFNASQAGTSPFPGSYLFADGVLCCAPFILFEDVNATLTSTFQSFEVNRRFPTDSRLQWLMGFRWVEWDDGLGLVGTSALSPQPVAIATCSRRPPAAAGTVSTGLVSVFTIHAAGEKTAFGSTPQTSAAAQATNHGDFRGRPRRTPASERPRSTSRLVDSRPITSAS